MTRKMNVTEYVAIIGLVLAAYGAILSTINSMVQLIAHRRDRADVILKVQRNMTAVGGSRFGKMKITIVTATNRGKRPVTVKGFATRLLDSWDVFWLLDVQPPLPYEITEGHSVYAHLDTAEENQDIIEGYYVWDSVGREFQINIAPWYRVLISRIRRKLAPVRHVKKKPA
jgi:hypothetical protein